VYDERISEKILPVFPKKVASKIAELPEIQRSGKGCQARMKDHIIKSMLYCHQDLIENRKEYLSEAIRTMIAVTEVRLFGPTQQFIDSWLKASKSILNGDEEQINKAMKVLRKLITLSLIDPFLSYSSDDDSEDSDNDGGDDSNSITLENIHTINPSLCEIKVKYRHPILDGGEIYILSNPTIRSKSGLPLYKIGYTNTGAEKRAKQLYDSGVARPFKVEFTIKSMACHRAETVVHQLLFNMRETNKREFFFVPLDVAIKVVKTTVAVLNEMGHTKPRTVTNKN